MSTESRASSLGPFAPEQGRRSLASVAAISLATAAAALAAARPLVVALSDREAASTTAWAQALALVAILAALVARYRIVSRGERGAGLARSAIAIAVAAGAFAFVYGGIRDGSLQLARFFDVYFDGEILALLWPDLLRGAVNTIKAAFLAEILAIVVGLVVATLVISPKPFAHYPAVWYVDLVRGTPLLVLTFLIYFGLTFVGIRLSPFVAIVTTLTVNASAYVAEIFRAGIQAVPRGQMDAARSLGMPHPTAMLFVVIPQAVRAVIPPLMSEFIALVKDTALVFFVVGATVQTGDIFFRARTAANSTFSPTPYMAAAILYLIITVPLTRLVGRVERRLRTGLA